MEKIHFTHEQCQTILDKSSFASKAKMHEGYCWQGESKYGQYLSHGGGQGGIWLKQRLTYGWQNRYDYKDNNTYDKDITDRLIESYSDYIDTKITENILAKWHECDVKDREKILINSESYLRVINARKSQLVTISRFGAFLRYYLNDWNYTGEETGFWPRGDKNKNNFNIEPYILENKEYYFVGFALELNAIDMGYLEIDKEPQSVMLLEVDAARDWVCPWFHFHYAINPHMDKLQPIFICKDVLIEALKKDDDNLSNFIEHLSINIDKEETE